MDSSPAPAGTFADGAAAPLPALDAYGPSDELAAAYERDGAVLVRGLFSPDDLARIREELAAHMTRTVPHLTRDVHFEADGKTVRVANELQRYAPFFADLLASPRQTDLVESVTGWRPQPFYAEYFAKQPHGSVAQPHQDSAFEHVEPRQYVHVWVALDDITPDMGPLRLWLGSNRFGVFPHDRRDFGKFQHLSPETVAGFDFPVVEGIAEAGDLFLLDTALVHASTPNTSSRPRPSLALAYRGVGSVHHDS
ncbi:phytanoyl-CoA dioxygenase family protein [Streptomyces anulatus]|uniref:phytanoyl-CoA dioxygenase family protein n=1 Tax=Streptomyces anulatus TaxID=1892 RepID=UPI0037211AF6